MIGKMGPKSAFNGLAAGLRSQPAARLIPFGLMNRLKMAAQAFARRMVPGVARASWINPSLILFVAGLWCLPLRGAADMNTGEFETPPPQPGSIQWEIIQQNARERQERYRKRVSIPDAMGTNVPRSTAANLINGPKMEAAPTPPSTASSGIVLQLLFFAAAFVLTGVLIVRRFAPRVLVDINQRFSPWALAPAAGWNPSARVRAEEKAFGEFLTVFRVGPFA